MQEGTSEVHGPRKKNIKGAVVWDGDDLLPFIAAGGSTGAEAASQHAFGLAEQPVGADVDVPAGRFDQAVGVRA